MNFRTLILGVGNEILSDDGIGPKLARDLPGYFKSDEFDFNIACCGGIELLELIRDFDRVILIDAIRTGNGIPGDVTCFRPSDFKETMHLSSLHDISFLTALKLGSRLNIKIPDDIHVIAVEILEDKQFGDKLTPEMEEKYPLIIEKTVKIIRQITGAG